MDRVEVSYVPAAANNLQPLHLHGFSACTEVHADLVLIGLFSLVFGSTCVPRTVGLGLLMLCVSESPSFVIQGCQVL